MENGLIDDSNYVQTVVDDECFNYTPYGEHGVARHRIDGRTCWTYICTLNTTFWKKRVLRSFDTLEEAEACRLNTSIELDYQVDKEYSVFLSQKFRMDRLTFSYN